MKTTTTTMSRNTPMKKTQNIPRNRWGRSDTSCLRRIAPNSSRRCTILFWENKQGTPVSCSIPHLVTRSSGDSTSFYAVTKTKNPCRKNLIFYMVTPTISRGTIHGCTTTRETWMAWSRTWQRCGRTSSKTTTKNSGLTPSTPAPAYSSCSTTSKKRLSPAIQNPHSDSDFRRFHTCIIHVHGLCTKASFGRRKYDIHDPPLENNLLYGKLSLLCILFTSFGQGCRNPITSLFHIHCLSR